MIVVKTETPDIVGSPIHSGRVTVCSIETAIKENKNVSNNTAFEFFDQVIIKPFDDKTVLKTLKHFLVKDK